MTEADDLIIIDPNQWTTAETLLRALNRYYGDPDDALRRLIDAYESGAVKSARVPYDRLQAYLHSDSILVKMGEVHEKHPELVTAEQIQDFVKDSSVLKGLDNSEEYCRGHLLRQSDLPWFYDEKGRRYFIYFQLKSAWGIWPRMRPATAPEPAEVTAQEPAEVTEKQLGRRKEWPRVLREMKDSGLTREELTAISVEDRRKRFKTSPDTFLRALEELEKETQK
jgi:hypothetical protein